MCPTIDAVEYLAVVAGTFALVATVFGGGGLFFNWLSNRLT